MMQILHELLDVYQKNPSEPLTYLPTDPDTLRNYLFEALAAIFNAIHQQSDIERAGLIVAFVEAVANQTGEAEHHALSAWGYGFLHLNRNISESARYFDLVRHFYASTQQTELEATALISYASQLSQIGRIKEAEQAILRAKDILQNDDDYADWPLLYLNLALVQFYQAQYENMLASAQQSKAMALKYDRLYPERTEFYRLRLVQAIINEAVAALLLGKMEYSEQRLNDVRALAEPHQWDEINGRVHLNLARIHTFQGKMFAALETLQQAENDFKVANIDIEQATVLLYQADVYQRLMMHLQSRNAAAQAAKILSQSNVVAEAIEAYLLAVRVSLERREIKRARRYLKASEPLMSQASPLLQAIRQSYAAHKIFNPDRSSIEKALQQADQAHQQLYALGAVAQMLTTALIAADLATTLGLPDIVQRYKMIIESCQDHNLIDLEQQAHLQLGTYYANTLSYTQAQFHLKRATEILTFKKEQMPIEELKANLIGGSTEVYTQLIEIFLHDKDILGKGTKNALNTLIEAKGGIWLDILSPAEPVAVPIEWTQAKAELAYWQEDVRKSTDETHIKLCEERIAHARKVLTRMTRSQFRQRTRQRLPTCEEIQKHLEPTQVILDYFVGSQQIWACRISQKEIRWFNLGSKLEVERNMSRLNMLFKNLLYVSDVSNSTSEGSLDVVANMRQQMSENQLTNIQQILSQLYTQLITPLQLETDANNLAPGESISELLLVPDGYLFELPWTALYDNVYLGQQYDLTLYPTSALLTFDDTLNKRRYPQTGCPYILGFQGDPPLQYLKNSLDAIQEIWPHAHSVNPAQTTDLTWEKVPLWLHIGAHGHVDRQTPLFSQLELADGPLLLADIFNLDLYGCELVTLSACETGTTPEQGGVLLALAGSFLCAGAKNVIASLWPVDDVATTILMGAFYRAYHTGMNPQQALRAAQQELRQAGYQHPFYWAAFQIFARGK